MKSKAIDLFAGIGGIRLGFERAFGDSMETVFASEFDRYAQKTYQANFSTPKYIHGDITQIPEDEIPGFDICLAGFPCQAFSVAGKRQGFDDSYQGRCRGTLFFDVARICKFHRPRVIFCENVRGLVSHDRGNTFKVITGTLEEMGYTEFHAVLNSRDFGVPQNRERVYIVAFRDDVDCSGFRFPEPMCQHTQLRDVLETRPVSVKYYLSTVYFNALIDHKRRQATKGNGFGFVIRDLDGAAGAIVCGGMGRERNLIVDDRLKDFTPVTRIKGEVNRDGIRRLTPRECARLQGFPDSFKLELSDARLYAQIGNTVTVPVIEAIAREIKRTLESAAGE